MAKVPLDDPLQFLTIVGMNPLKTDTFSKSRKIVSLLAIAMSLFFGLLELLLNSNGLETYARASEGMVPLYQVICKLTILIKYRKELSQLVTDCQKFWKLDKFGARFSDDCTHLHKLLRRFFLLYKITITVSFSLFVAIKIFANDDKPIVIAYGENQGLESPYDQLYFILHLTGVVIAVSLMNGLDGLFFYFVGHILSELMMVKIAFGNHNIIAFRNERERFKITTEHHSFVLEFIHRFNHVYSMLLLNQHFTALFGICFGLFLVSKDGMPPSLDLLGKYTVYIMAFILQTFTFSFAGSLIINWSIEIPDAIFYNDWGKDEAYKDKLGKIISMQRGQRKAKLTLGGFADLDLASFNFVLKNGFSFFTFINTMINK